MATASQHVKPTSFQRSFLARGIKSLRKQKSTDKQQLLNSESHLEPSRTTEESRYAHASSRVPGLSSRSRVPDTSVQVRDDGTLLKRATDVDCDLTPKTSRRTDIALDLRDLHLHTTSDHHTHHKQSAMLMTINPEEHQPDLDPDMLHSPEVTVDHSPELHDRIQIMPEEKSRDTDITSCPDGCSPDDHSLSSGYAKFENDPQKRRNFRHNKNCKYVKRKRKKWVKRRSVKTLRTSWKWLKRGIISMNVTSHLVPFPMHTPSNTPFYSR